MMCKTLLASVFILISVISAWAQPLVFLVRHAERADGGGKPPGMMADDPDLSAAGRARAERLAQLLKDARITAIYTTEYKRTRQTAVPLAKALGLEPVVVTSKDGASLVQKLEAAAGPVLVIGHSNSVPDTIKALGVTEAVTIGDQDFDNLFVVIRGPTATLVRLHY
jgi:phosphohistidine phosphatase SixA